MKYITIISLLLLFACNNKTDCFDCFYNQHTEAEKEAIDKMHTVFEEFLDTNFDYNSNFTKAAKTRAYLNNIGYNYISFQIDSAKIKDALLSYSNASLIRDSMENPIYSPYLKKLYNCLDYDYADSLIYYMVDNYYAVGDLNYGNFLNNTAFAIDNEQLASKMIQHIIIHEFFSDEIKYLLKSDSSNSSTHEKKKFIKVEN